MDGVGGNIVDVANPVLAYAANNGGPAWTVAVLPGSPAIGAGVAIPGVTTDERGVTRPPGQIDIGAYQDRGFTISVAAGSSPQTTPVNKVFPSTLDVIVQSPYADPVAGGVITYSDSDAGPSASLSSGTATLDSNGVAGVIAQANDVIGSYQVSASAKGTNGPVAFNLVNGPG